MSRDTGFWIVAGLFAWGILRSHQTAGGGAGTTGAPGPASGTSDTSAMTIYCDSPDADPIFCTLLGGSQNGG